MKKIIKLIIYAAGFVVLIWLFVLEKIKSDASFSVRDGKIVAAFLAYIFAIGKIFGNNEDDGSFSLNSCKEKFKDIIKDSFDDSRRKQKKLLRAIACCCDFNYAKGIEKLKNLFLHVKPAMKNMLLIFL